MNKEKLNDINSWLPIKYFDDNIYLKTGEVIKILEVKPINFKLRSDAEQIAILESYKRFLKQCDFQIQIIIQTYKNEIGNHIDKIEKYSYGNEKLTKIMLGYKNLIVDITNKKKSITRKFFIVIKSDKNIDENIKRIVNGLNACGNEVVLCSKEKIEEILKVYFFSKVSSEE